MSAQKYIFGVAFLIATLLAINSIPASEAVNSYVANTYANKSNHLIMGSRLPGDRLVLRQSVVKASSWMKVQIVEKTFNVSRWERITMIRALDQKTNGNGAYPSVSRGGLGQNNVTLKFKSQRGHGINFVVELYARN